MVANPSDEPHESPAGDGLERLKLTAILDRLPTCILLRDQQGRILYANQMMRESFAHDIQPSLAAQHFRGWNLQWPDGRPCDADELPTSRSLRGETVLREEVMLRGSDGGWRHLAVSAAPLYDEHDQIICSLVATEDITERRRAEKAVQDREQHLRDIFNNMAAMIGVLDMDGILIEANQAALRMLDLEFDDVVGKSLVECRCLAWSPETQRQLQSAIERAVKGETSRFDATIQVADNQFRTIDFMLSPMYDSACRVAYLIPSAIDITQRTDAEEALRHERESAESERNRLQAVLEVLPVAVFIADADGRVHATNKVADQIWTVARLSEQPEHYGEDYKAWWTANGRRVQAHEWGMARALAHAEVCVAEEMLIETSDGQRKVILNYAQPILDGDGNVTGGVAVNIDISERKEAEDALRESEEKFRKAFQTNPCIMVISSLEDGRFLDCNEAFEKIVGYPRDEVIGISSLSVNIWQNPEERQQLVQQMRENGYLRNFEVVIQTKSGENRTVMVSAEAINLKGMPHVISAWLDITERKEREEEVRQLNENLEVRVRERTELAEARARQLQVLAVELIEAEERERQRISDLLHDDLQQLLAGARLQLQAASRNLPPTPALANVENLLEECIRKSRRLSHELSPAVLNHSGLVDALVWLGRQMAEQVGLDVQLEVDAAEHFEATPLKIFLFRAVQELLFNVFKHAGVKHARVELRRDAEWLQIVVSDRGKGFDPAIIDSSTVSGGVGILSLRERARFIGGRLDIQSSPGAGSHFMLRIPLRISGSALSAPLESVTQPVTAAAGGDDHELAARLRILFADDHQVVRQALVAMLTGQPDILVVGEAANGLEAVELAHELHPDLVIMDVTMPVMDGLEATRRIRRELPDVRVIGLSMFEDEQIATAMQQAGATAFVSKTASPGELLKAIYATRS